MASPSQTEIQELVRRLQQGNYSPEHILEAADVLVSALPAPEGFRLAVEFFSSPHNQVRKLGAGMMKALGPRHEAAHFFLEGTKDAARLLGAGLSSAGAAPGADKPAPDYSAIGEVIKAWIRGGRSRG